MRFTLKHIPNVLPFILLIVGYILELFGISQTFTIALISLGLFISLLMNWQSEIGMYNMIIQLVKLSFVVVPLAIYYTIVNINGTPYSTNLSTLFFVCNFVLALMFAEKSIHSKLIDMGYKINRATIISIMIFFTFLNIILLTTIYTQSLRLTDDKQIYEKCN